MILGTFSLGWETLYFVPAVVLQILLGFGLSTLAAALVVPFRDIGNVIPFALRIWLYLSPIIWPLSYLEELDPTAQFLFKFNPMAGILSMHRTALTGSELDVVAAWIATGVACVAFLVGLVAFRRSEQSMTRYL